MPARARLTARLRTRLGEAVGDELMPAAAAARRYGVSDRTAAAAFTHTPTRSSLTWTKNPDREAAASTSSAAASRPRARGRRAAL